MSKEIEINILPSFAFIKEKVVNKLSWRDSWKDISTGEMNEIFYEGEGGALNFYYDTKSKRTVPYAEDVYRSMRKSCSTDIKNYLHSLNHIEYDIAVDLPQRITIVLSQKDNLDNIDDITTQIENTIRQNKWGTCFVSTK